MQFSCQVVIKIRLDRNEVWNCVMTECLLVFSNISDLNIICFIESSYDKHNINLNTLIIIHLSKLEKICLYRQTDRLTDRHTTRQTHTHTHRDTHTQTHTHTDTHRHTHTDTHRHTHTDTHTHTHTHRHTHRHRHTDTHTHTTHTHHTHTHNTGLKIRTTIYINSVAQNSTWFPTVMSVAQLLTFMRSQ